MSAPENPSNSHERVESDTWWRVKTGWTDAELQDRKNALLKRIRSRWPKFHKSPGMLAVIESLVVTFDDNSWCLPEEEDRSVVFAEQLRLYVKWAKYLQSEHKSLFKEKLDMMPGDDMHMPLPLFTRTVIPSAVSQLAEALQCFIAPLTNSSLTARVSAMAPGAAKQPFDWQDVEVRLQLDFTYPTHSDAVYAIPMPVLKAENASEPCKWTDFSYCKFLDYCQRNWYIKPKGLFWIDGKEWAPIQTSGDYALMLKRFSEKRDTDGILHLLMVSHSYPVVTPSGDGFSAVARSLLKQSGVN